MNAFIACALLLGGLFILAYFTKRRFGILGLALCAGSLLSVSWTATLTPFLQQNGISFISPPLEAVVAVALTLLPSMLLFFGGPAYTKQWARIIGAAGYALFAFVLVSVPLAQGLVSDGISQAAFGFIAAYGNLLIIASIGLALADILVARSPKGGKHEH